MPVIPKQLTSEISRKEHIILCTLIGIVYLCDYETINRNMDTVIHNDQMVIRPIDALWALFKSQPKSVQDAFTKRLLADKETISIQHQKETLKISLQQAMKELREAEESDFENLQDGRNLFK